MKRIFVYDDTVSVPADIAELAGLSAFGKLVYCRRSLAEHIADMAREAGFDRFVHLRGSGDIAALKEMMRDHAGGDQHCVMTADTMTASREDFVIFLKKILHAPRPVGVFADERRNRCLLAMLPAALIDSYVRIVEKGRNGDALFALNNKMVPVPNDGAMIVLEDFGVFCRFLSSNFTARYFNSLNRDGFDVIKRSADKEKMRREHDAFYLLPTALQPFFVQPFDFRDEGNVAGYRMEWIRIPDMAVQWVHGGLSDAEFDAFLERMFDFFARRPGMECDAKEAGEKRRTLYVDKVATRMAALRKTAHFMRVDALVAAGTKYASLEDMTAAYLSLYEKLAPRLAGSRPCISHGDPCFSNILYDKRTGLLKMIDPKGALCEEDLYLDPLYDIAKLSHSILGGYDFINNNQFRLHLDEDLSLRLKLFRPDIAAKQAAFMARLQAASQDPVLVRLAEASLFLSMLPLHIDLPDKVFAFVLTAAEILEWIEARL